MKIKDGQQVKIVNLTRKQLIQTVQGLWNDNQRLAQICDGEMKARKAILEKLEPFRGVNRLELMLRPEKLMDALRDILTPPKISTNPPAEPEKGGVA